MPRQDISGCSIPQRNPGVGDDAAGKMQPTSRFGEVFRRNLMAAAAGFIGGAKAVPGRSWRGV